MTAMEVCIVSKDQLPEAAMAVEAEELPRLVALLCEKNDQVRYQVFLALQYRSRVMGDVYPFWDTFRAKLGSDNAYQRSIGLMLIAENVRWDSQDRMRETIGAFLERLTDDKPITVRQCIQSLETVCQYKPELAGGIAARLMAMDLSQIKETMRKLILTDALHVLAGIRKNHPSGEIDRFMLDALSGNLLDVKTKKMLRTML